MANIRDFLYKKGLRFVKQESQREGGTQAKHASLGSHASGGNRNPTSAKGLSFDKPVKISPETNRNPLKQTISRMPTKWERRFRKLREFTIRSVHTIRDLGYVLWDLRWWREKTPQELQREKDLKERMELEAKLYKEGKLYAKRISNAYARMGYCYIPPKTERSFLNNTRKVRFSNIVGEPNAIWLKFDVPRLPHGVDLMKLINDENVISNVAASCRHHIQTKYEVDKGAWICVERGRGVRGIPNQVSYRKLMELMDPQRDRLTIPLGETVNNRRIYRSFEPFPHMLVGGATGNGKTNHLNMVLAALIEQNSPQDLEFILVDLKNGIEFDIYKGLPHLKPIPNVEKSGIVGRNDQVIPTLEYLIQEGERRLNVFKKAGVTNIKQYNRHRQEDRMPRLFFIIDEWARIALRGDGKVADELLAEITATYRAVGYHVVVATQMPKVKVVSTLIKTNLSARLAFGVPSNNESMVILDNGKATGLQPAGRALFKFGMTEVELQTPLVERETLKGIVKKAIQSEGKVDSRDKLSMEDILRYSLEYLNGSLAVRPLFDHFQGKIGKNRLQEWLISFDEKIVNVDGQSYQVIPPGGGSVPRKLERYPPEEPPHTPDRDQE